MTNLNVNQSNSEPIIPDDFGPPAGHGHIFSPGSRAFFAFQAGELDVGALNQREAGKFFPHTSAGLSDPFAPDDVKNELPPPDGKIASANQSTGQMLDKPGRHWKKYDVRGGDTIDILWTFTANHITRRWNYFITKDDWNPDMPLSRDQFETEPFYTVQINLTPFWSNTDAMKPPSPTNHTVALPMRNGYHVLLGVWEVADTGNAFYQVVDLNFIEQQTDAVFPSTPTNLQAKNVSDKMVELAWAAPDSPTPIVSYRITRNGMTTIDSDASNLSWTDYSVRPETGYHYFISSIGENDLLSAPSKAIQVHTLPEGGENAPPTAPVNLHSMGETATSVSLMWGPSIGGSKIVNYVIYRDGKEIQRVGPKQTSYNDTELKPDTVYRYFAAAADQAGKLSVPSNVMKISTKAQNSDNVTQYRPWRIRETYKTNEKITHNGKIWRCIQGHVSYAEDWAPGLSSSITLWEQVS